MTIEHETIRLAKELISRPSVTPHDEGCQTLMSEYLTPLGFGIESLFFVDSFWSRYP